MFSLPVDLGVNSRSSCGSEECQISVVSTGREVALKPDKWAKWDPRGTIREVGGIKDTIYNDAIFDVMMASMADGSEHTKSSGPSQTELDGHANMPVVGRNCYILSELGKYVDVSPFTPAYKALRAPMVDAVIQYDSPYDGKSYMLVIRNALHVPSMMNNLLPPFMLREAGVEVNDKAKIHTQDPTTDNHAIIFGEMGFKIPLSLSGIFSYFTTTKLTNNMLQDPSEVYILMPARWDPHSDVYAHNEDNMLDWEGNMKEPKHCDQWLVLDKIPDDEAMASSLLITEE